MVNISRIILHPGKEEPLRRYHPWVFSGAIRKIEGPVSSGSHVEVFSSRQEYLGCGIYQPATIAVRILAFAPRRPDSLDMKFWKEKIQNAFRLRQILDLTDNPMNNAYRLMHGEGDLVPGLIIDHYNGHLVIQFHAAGLQLYLEHISEALKEIYGENLVSIFDKSKETIPGHAYEGGLVLGNSKEVTVTENGHLFHVDIEKGQKTGYYLDQRENRQLLSGYSKGKKVLNTFSYSGGFSVYALRGGASLVHSVDSSAKAIELTNQNVMLNFAAQPAHEAIQADTLNYLQRSQEEYDVIILDPPAYSKHTSTRHNALQGYKRLNLEALKKIKPGGILFTFSCSQVVDRVLFRSTIMAAAIASGRTTRLLHHLSQPADHPVSIFHPEGEYLKGLVLQIE